MVFDIFLYRQGDGAGERVATIGVAVDVVIFLFVDPVVNLVADDSGGDRCVAAAQSLAGGDDIGDNSPVFDAKIATGAAVAGDNLVDDHQDIVAVADLAQGREIVGWGHQAATRGARDGFGDKGGDIFAALLFDHALQLLGAGEGAGGLVFAVGAVVGIGKGDMGEVEQIGYVVIAPARATRHRERADGIAVPGLPAGDYLVLFWVAGFEVILAGDLEPGLGGFGAAGDEKYPVEVAGGHGGDLGGEVDLGLGEEAGVGEAHFVGLSLHGGSDFGYPMPDRDHVDAGAGIEVCTAIFGVEVRALAVRDLRPVAGDDAVEDAIGGGHVEAFLSG